MKYHYTYQIENTVLHKCYIGARTSDIHPLKDIGKRYFSSSRDAKFMEDQRKHPENYEYRIIGMFYDKSSLLNHEIELHEIYNVGKNSLFYNRARQTSTGFSTIGVSPSEETRQKLSKRSKKFRHTYETKQHLKEINSGEGNPMYGKRGLDCPNYKRTYTEEQLLAMKGRNKGRIHSDEEKERRRLSVIETNKKDPSISERKREAMLGKNRGKKYGKVYHHYETGERMTIKDNEQVPEEFVLGRYKEKMFNAHNRGKICITNGLINKYIDKNFDLPDGFQYGMKNK